MYIGSLAEAPANTVSSTQGWTSSPGGRGTFDIIWGSCLTIFLCGWTTICVNVPARGSTSWQRLQRKCLVFCEALAGPEFIFHTALGQYLAAKQSVTKFASAGFPGWTMRHGFFAGMGGFVLLSSDFVPFPITADQVYYLVVNGYISYDDVCIDKEDIEDRNKFDSLTRVLTTAQLLWFVLNVCARGALGMAITTLELSTIAFIFCTIFTCFFWRYKPQDVSSPIAIELKTPLASVLVSAGDIANQPYSYTPLDFINEKPHWFQLLWRYCFNILRFFKINFHDRKRPIDKIWDDEFPHMNFFYSAFLVFIQLGFASIHFAAWNFHFPTDIERTLWRIATCCIVFCIIGTWIIMYTGFSLVPGIALRVEKHVSPRVDSLGAKLYWKLKKVCQYRCNTSPDQNVRESLPLPVAVCFVPLSIIYISFRACIIIEDIINLRSIPSSAYDAIDWTSFLPHF